ncbi:MAG: hypoxanthine phosphoribosyltransferase [Candidatus Sumerlaeia bacterium]
MTINDTRISEILISGERIQARIAALAGDIARDYAGRELVLVGVLKGSVMFLADLSRALTIPHVFDMVGAASYLGGTASTGSVIITKDIHLPIRDKHVLLVEDIYDTGRTMRVIVDLLKVHQPASLEICALLYKEKPHDEDMPVKYIGFRIPDRFVVGYGLDYDEHFRNLPFIAEFKP